VIIETVEQVERSRSNIEWGLSQSGSKDGGIEPPGGPGHHVTGRAAWRGVCAGDAASAATRRNMATAAFLQRFALTRSRP
jgi:hypothetical protein